MNKNFCQFVGCMRVSFFLCCNQRPLVRNDKTDVYVYGVDISDLLSYAQIYKIFSFFLFVANEWLKIKVDKDKRATYLDYWRESKTLARRTSHLTTHQMASGQNLQAQSKSMEKLAIWIVQPLVSKERSLLVCQNKKLQCYTTKFSMKETLHLVNGLPKKNDLISIRPTEMSFL